MKYPHLLLILALLSGCTALDAVSTVASIASPEKPAIGIDAQVGDKVVNVGETDNSMTEIEDNEGIVTVTSTKTDKNFGNAEKIEVNEGPDWFMLSLLSLGWLLPGPGQIYGEVKSWFVRE